MDKLDDHLSALVEEHGRAGTASSGYCNNQKWQGYIKKVLQKKYECLQVLVAKLKDEAKMLNTTWQSDKFSHVRSTVPRGWVMQVSELDMYC